MSEELGCHGDLEAVTVSQRERERGGGTAEMEVGGAGLLKAENRNGERAERSGRKLKWEMGKGNVKLGIYT